MQRKIRVACVMIGFQAGNAESMGMEWIGKTPIDHRCFSMVGRQGFEPWKAQGQQIYSLSRLTASVPTRAWPC